MAEEYRIKMLAAPANKAGGPPIAEGYYGPVKDVTMNQPIYCRVPREQAWVYTRADAIRVVLGMRGWPCQCEPPITLTL